MSADKGFVKHDFEDGTVIKLQRTIFVRSFHVLLFLISFNVQTLLLKQILIRISMALVPEILRTQKASGIHRHHHSFYYHFSHTESGEGTYPRSQVPSPHNANHTALSFKGEKGKRKQRKRKKRTPAPPHVCLLHTVVPI